MSIVFVGVTYFEPDESCDDGTCIAIYSNELIPVYERLIKSVDCGMDKWYIGYISIDDNDKTILDAIKDIVTNSNDSMKIKYRKICDFLTPIDKPDKTVLEINPYFDDWKKVYA